MPDDLIEFEELQDNEFNYQQASNISPSGPLLPTSPPSVSGGPMQNANQLLTGRGLPMSEPDRNWSQQNLPMSAGGAEHHQALLRSGTKSGTGVQSRARGEVQGRQVPEEKVQTQPLRM